MGKSPMKKKVFGGVEVSMIPSHRVVCLPEASASSTRKANKKKMVPRNGARAQR